MDELPRNLVGQSQDVDGDSSACVFYPFSCVNPENMRKDITVRITTGAK